MAKEKPTDPDKAARKAAKAEKKAKRSETDGVHKSSSKKDSKKENATAAAAADAENIDASTKLLNKLEAEAPGTVVVKDTETSGTLAIQAKTAPILGALVPFAHPLAEEKTCKKVLKGVKKAAKSKTLKRGVKEVVKSLRKSAPQTTGGNSTTTGIVILAADISPMDVISHIPVLCEDHGIPYIFVPSRAELGAAGSTKRPTSVVMVGRDKGGNNNNKEGGDEDWPEVFGELVKVVVKAGRDVRV